MIKVYKSYEDRLVELDREQIEDGVWISLTQPSAEELEFVEKLTEAPQDFVRAALDPEESSRIEIEDNQILVLVNVPLARDANSEEYDTLPLGIIVTPDYFVTISQNDCEALLPFNADRAKYFCTFKRTRFLFQILYRSAALFLKDLRQMTRRSDRIEDDLRQSMKNHELFQLLDLQKGLTYYAMSLRSNRAVIEKLLRLCANPQVSHIIKLREEDEDLLDDVRVEYDQAIEMAQIQTDVLAGMMDAFASVISNNLNIVMKFLASVTIVMAIPSMISSFFGMNVPMPWGRFQYGFAAVCLLSLASMAAAVWILWKKKLF